MIEGFLKITGIAVIVLITMFIGGCASVAPVPGSTENVNEAYYHGPDDFVKHVDGIAVGMAEPEVFDKLGRPKAALTILRRDEIVTALLGTNNVEVRDGVSEARLKRTVLQSLYGYRMNYVSVHSRHGFSSPIRIQTDEEGYNYTLTLIFSDGRLFEKPILTGGVVNQSSSKTFFDYINPGTVISRTP